MLINCPDDQLVEMNLIIQVVKKYKYILILVLGIICLTILEIVYLPEGVDWVKTYRPATIALLNGLSPYAIDIYFAPPWALIPLIPFALLPEQIGRGAIFSLGLIVFAYTAVKLGGNKIALTAFVLSPPVIHCLYNSNIEWMPILGFILPPQIGIFFVSIKPQIGIGIAIYWLFSAWRKGGFREIIRIFAPFIIVLILSFLVFGFWPSRFRETISLTQSYNSSIWPLGIPIGILLLIKAFRSKNSIPAMAAGPFLSPYVLFHAYSGAIISLVPSAIESVGVSIGLWIIILIRALNW